MWCGGTLVLLWALQQGTVLSECVGCQGPQAPLTGPAVSSCSCLLSSPSYEVQLESKVRRKGLGKFLIQILQLMANR